MASRSISHERKNQLVANGPNRPPAARLVAAVQLFDLIAGQRALRSFPAHGSRVAATLVTQVTLCWVCIEPRRLLSHIVVPSLCREKYNRTESYIPKWQAVRKAFLSI
jgi:hypothetical protein